MAAQFPILSFDQANPLLMGLQRGGDIYKQFKMTPLQIKEAEVANEINQQKQQQQAMYLQKYPELLAAELAKAQLEPEEMKARNSLIGGQLREIEQRLKYNPEIWASETAQRRAQTEGLNRKNALIQDLLSGKIPGQSPMMNQSSYQQGIQQNLASPEVIQQVISQRNNIPQQQKGMNGLNYAQAALLSDQLGLPKPEIKDIDGKLIGITAFGNVPIAEGLSPLQKELTKGDAKIIEDLEKNVLSSTIKQETLDELSSVVTNPSFQAMRQIPIAGKYELEGYSKFGTPEQKKLVGQYMTLTGQIIKDSARDFAGQFRIGEQALLNSMKPSLSDTYETATGKIEALSLMNKMLMERSRIMSDLMRERGLSLNKATSEADKLINADEIRNGIKQRLEPVSGDKSEQRKVINGKTYMIKNNKVYEL